jgi:protein-L-isoaspartate(D-aspartate) O-methyltransferase
MTCWVATLCALPLVSCARPEPRPEAGGAAEEGRAPGSYEVRRKELVEELKREGIRDRDVIDAIGAVERHRFVRDAERELAYGNFPLAIGHGQTISQPYVVAFMTQAAKLSRTSNVLEVGTGSGYQAAVLAEVLGLGPSADPSKPHGKLCSIEIIPELAQRADATLKELGYRDVAVKAGDGYRGWPERAPFDAILVTAAPDHVPEPLKEQLAIDGRLVIPVGEYVQDLMVIRRTRDGFVTEDSLPVRFVPMTGEAQEPRR